jgi:hypothetical protein
VCSYDLITLIISPEAEELVASLVKSGRQISLLHGCAEYRNCSSSHVSVGVVLPRVRLSRTAVNHNDMEVIVLIIKF